MIFIDTILKSREQLSEEYSYAEFIDLSFWSKDFGRRLNPYYPYGDIPIPYDSGCMKACCVESVWQGLKVFEEADVDKDVFQLYQPNELERVQYEKGNLSGFRRGVYGHDILTYEEAYRGIYVKTYKWMIENHAKDIIDSIREIHEKTTIVLLDVNTNYFEGTLGHCLSHAYLVKAYTLGLPPFEDFFEVKDEHHYMTNGRRSWYDIEKKRVPKEIIFHNDKQMSIDFY